MRLGCEFADTAGPSLVIREFLCPGRQDLSSKYKETLWMVSYGGRGVAFQAGLIAPRGRDLGDRRSCVRGDRNMMENDDRNIMDERRIGV